MPRHDDIEPPTKYLVSSRCSEQSLRAEWIEVLKRSVFNKTNMKSHTWYCKVAHKYHQHLQPRTKPLTMLPHNEWENYYHDDRHCGFCQVIISWRNDIHETCKTFGKNVWRLHFSQRMPCVWGKGRRPGGQLWLSLGEYLRYLWKLSQELQDVQLEVPRR